ncbi:MAG: NUDIX domain-containing protein [Chlamydiales bacterium]|nr:NUDIX domain-containing protein [Chlamydiales bacterium]
MRLKLLFVLVLHCLTLHASTNEYLDLMHRYPQTLGPLGDASKGEIEITLDLNEIRDIQLATGRQVGIVAQDNYWIWINDACHFPNGRKGVYGRIAWKRRLSDFVGAAAMPMLPDGRIVMNLMFRHSTRCWEVELPRGMAEAGETVAEAAAREAREETGMVVSNLVRLGDIASDTGISGTTVPIFLAQVTDQVTTERDDAEAIEDVFAMSIPEIKAAFVKGYYETEINGKKITARFRDPFLAYGVLLYEAINGQNDEMDLKR